MAKYPASVTAAVPSCALTDTFALLYAVEVVDMDEHQAM